MNRSCHLHTQAAIFRLPLRLPLRPLQQNPRCCSFSESGPPFQTVRKHARRDPGSTNGIFPFGGRVGRQRSSARGLNLSKMHLASLQMSMLPRSDLPHLASRLCLGHVNRGSDHRLAGRSE